MLTDEQMRDVLKNTNHMVRNSMHGPFWPELEGACRAIESAATEPMLQRIAELEKERDEWKHDALNGANAQYLREKNAELKHQLEEARKDAERWRTFLSTRPQSTHEVIIQAIDDAAMRKGKS